MNRFKLEMMDYSFLGEAARSVLQEGTFRVYSFPFLVCYKRRKQSAHCLLTMNDNRLRGDARIHRVITMERLPKSGILDVGRLL